MADASTIFSANDISTGLLIDFNATSQKKTATSESADKGTLYFTPQGLYLNQKLIAPEAFSTFKVSGTSQLDAKVEGTLAADSPQDVMSITFGDNFWVTTNENGDSFEINSNGNFPVIEIDTSSSVKYKLGQVKYGTFGLRQHGCYFVWLKNSNTTISPELNINGTGSHPIYIASSTDSYSHLDTLSAALQLTSGVYFVSYIINNDTAESTGKYVFFKNITLHINADNATHATSADNATRATRDSSGNILFNTYVKKSAIGASTVTDASGITSYGIPYLDSSGRIPSSLLPSYVDDVLEYKSFADFPKDTSSKDKPESGKIYVDTSTNLTYRWGGTQYVEISQSLAIGTTEGTAYSGKKGSDLESALESAQNDIAAIKKINYAGSTSAGGSANSAEKLTTNAGDACTGVYFSEGVPVACSYQIKKSVPANAIFTDNSVTAEKYHYTPTGNTNSSLSVAASNITSGYTSDITRSVSTDNPVKVITGIQISRDTKGHVTALSGSTTNIWSTDKSVIDASHHYTPVVDASSKLSVDASSVNSKNITGTTGVLSVVTGVDILRDSKGHVTGLSVDSQKIYSTDNNTNTHNTSKNVVGNSSAGTTNTNVLNGGVYLNHLENSSVTSSHKISGSGNLNVESDTNGNITVKMYWK